jgi:hypothetical protein
VPWSLGQQLTDQPECRWESGRRGGHARRVVSLDCSYSRALSHGHGERRTEIISPVMPSGWHCVRLISRFRRAVYTVSNDFQYSITSHTMHLLGHHLPDHKPLRVSHPAVILPPPSHSSPSLLLQPLLQARTLTRPPDRPHLLLRHLAPHLLPSPRPSTDQLGRPSLPTHRTPSDGALRLPLVTRYDPSAALPPPGWLIFKLERCQLARQQCGRRKGQGREASQRRGSAGYAQD